MLIVEYVGILATLRNRDRRTVGERVQASLGPAAVVDPSTYPIATPWGSSTLERIVFEDIFGDDLPCNTRAAAMRLDTVARARTLLVSTIADTPLRALEGDAPIAEQPAWINSAGDGTAPQLRLAWTVDDLIFYGWSVWWRENDADGYPVNVGRVNMGDWTINADNKVEIDGQVQKDDEVIVFAGLHEGILTFGVDVLEDARLLARNIRQRIANPVPAVDLHQTEGNPLSKEERKELIEGWAASRAGKNGGVAYSSPKILVRELGMAADAQLMIEGSNASAVRQARIVGVHAGMVDATAPKASLNYETQTGRNTEFRGLDCKPYMLPITARLSLDDVCAPGQRIAFDTSYDIEPALPPTGPSYED